MEKPSLKILCLNSGSSSLKFSLYQMGENGERLLHKGAIERIGLPDGKCWLQDGKGKIIEAAGNYADHNAAINQLFKSLNEQPAAIGHRVVHGGEFFTAPIVIDEQIIEKLTGLIDFAPLHLPGEIDCIRALGLRFPGLPQVACFDTAFHRKMPEIARRFPLPRQLWDEGVQRYGFHGLSYEYILEALGSKAQNKRIVIAHLGNGASMAAVCNGQPQDTTMGFTPTGGFMMGSRSGDLDPGVLIYMLRKKGYNVNQIDDIVNQRSGLSGVSGLSSDMKTLLDAADNPRAGLAVEMYCYQIRKTIGSLAAALSGLDLLIFTGGIGEKAAPVRAMVCSGLQFLGISLDEEQNRAHAQEISGKESRCLVMVIPTKEDLMIARHTKRIIDNGETLCPN